MHIAVAADPGREWDEFVEASPGALLGHAAAWAQVMREAYGLAPCYLEARSQQGSIVGVLPLVRFRGLRGRIELISMPFLDSGGALASDTAVASALRHRALELARESGAEALELREVAGTGDLEADQPRVDLVLALEDSEDSQWGALGAKVRNQTRKAEREGLRLDPHSADGAQGSLDGFYAPFQHNMRDLGSPVHSERFFAAAAAAFGKRLRFVVTRRADRPVGGLVAIHFARAVSVPWASTLRAERPRCPNNQIYWEALRWAIELGAAEFDFGRSPRGAGTYRFKTGWGAQERPLAWSRWSPNGEHLDCRPPGDNAWLRRLSRLWSRLPVGLTRLLGPPLRRRISS